MGYAAYKLEVLPSHEADAAWREQRLQAWITAWDGARSLVDWFGYRMADATPIERYQAIDYMYYEDLESMFCSDGEDACRLTALVLGEVLVAHFGFQWCRSNVFADEPLQVHHPDGQSVLHLPAMVLHALVRPYDEVLDELLWEIATHHLVLMSGYHWLLYLRHDDWTPEQQLSRFGACPPQPLRRRIRLMAHKDEELLVRYFGMTEFLPDRRITQKGDWGQFEQQIKGAWERFDETYGPDWSEHVVQEIRSKDRIELMMLQDHEMFGRLLLKSDLNASLERLPEQSDFRTVSLESYEQQYELTIDAIWQKFDETFGPDWSTRLQDGLERELDA